MIKIKNLIPFIALLGMAACNAEPKQEESAPAVEQVEATSPAPAEAAPAAENNSTIKVKIGTDKDGKMTSDIEAEVKK